MDYLYRIIYDRIVKSSDGEEMRVLEQDIIGGSRNRLTYLLKSQGFQNVSVRQIRICGRPIEVLLLK